jgi:glycerophosphodiester phosphodiesterase
MYASNIQSPRGNPVSVLGDVTSRKRRSRSVTQDQERGAIEIQDRMQHTVEFKAKGFKQNTRGHFIQDSFTTLEELLAELPESIGCNVELSMSRFPISFLGKTAPIN